MVEIKLIRKIHITISGLFLSNVCTCLILSFLPHLLYNKHKDGLMSILCHHVTFRAMPSTIYLRQYYDNDLHISQVQLSQFPMLNADIVHWNNKNVWEVNSSAAPFHPASSLNVIQSYNGGQNDLTQSFHTVILHTTNGNGRRIFQKSHASVWWWNTIDK